MIFSWLSWLVVLLMGACARRRRRRRRSRARWRHRDMQPWFTVYFFDTGHPCFDQLTPVKTRHLLTVSRDHIAGSSLQRIKVTCFLKLLVFDWLRARVRLTCYKQGRIARKPVNSNPGLKFIRITTFSSFQMVFLAALFCVCGDYKTQKRKPNNNQKTSPQSYRTQIKILPFSWVSFNRALNNPAKELRF